MRFKLLLASAAVLLTVGTPVASAHTTLISASPSKNSIISSAPSKILLTFEDPLLTLKGHQINKVVLTDSAKQIVPLSVIKVDGAKVIAQLATRLTKTGNYTVMYRVSAQDGHIVTGSYIFTLRN